VLELRRTTYLVTLIALVPKYVIFISIYSLIFFHYIDTYYVFWRRLRTTGLLPLACLVEGDNFRQMMHHQDHTSQFGFDYPLVCTLLARWRPETHTFHFPWGR
jgi:hypothetical protein